MLQSLDIVDWVGVWVASSALFVLSSAWHGPLFCHIYMRAYNMKMEDMANMPMPDWTINYFTAFLQQFVACWVQFLVLKSLEANSVLDVVIISLFIWVGFNLTEFLNDIMWEGKNMGIFWVQIAGKLTNQVLGGIIYLLMRKNDIF